MENRNLHHFYLMVGQLTETSSILEKTKILTESIKNDPEIVTFLRYVYDPYLQFFVTHEVAMRKGSLNPLGILYPTLGEELTDILNQFSKRLITGQVAHDRWFTFITTLPDHKLKDLAGRILNKDLKCRLGVKTVNKVLTSLSVPLIDVHEVSLGVKWNGEKVWKDKEGWYASRKLDGVRCSLILKNGVVTALSRQGKPFLTIGNLLNSIKYSGPDIIIDGELSLRNEYGKDDFSGIMKVLRRKDYQIPNPVLHVFDVIEIGRTQFYVFRDRIQNLKKLVEDIDSPYIKMVKQIPVKSEEQFQKLRMKAEAKKWEGLMLRKNTPYKAGRSKDLLKVKSMQDLEAKIIGIEKGKMNIVKNGKEKTVNIMTRAVIKYRGCKIGVGSGWTVKQRRRYFKHPEKLIGRTATIQYFEETRNKKGGYGLRFPVIKHLYVDNRIY